MIQIHKPICFPKKRAKSLVAKEGSLFKTYTILTGLPNNCISRFLRK